MKKLDLLPEEYHALKFDITALPNLAKAGPLSASVLCKARDPLQFLLQQEMKTTAAMDHGSLVDCLWTTPELFEEQYIILPDDAPQRPTEAMLKAKKPSPESVARQQWWAAFEAKASSKQLVSRSDYDKAHAAHRMLAQHPLANELIHSSLRQVALVGESPYEPGTQAKCLFDLLPMDDAWADCIVDLKTTNDPSDYGVANTMHRFEYHLKMAYYRKLCEAAGLGRRPHAILIWQRSSYPFDVHVRQIDPADLALGDVLVERRIESLKRMDIHDITPHFDTTLRTIPLADWMRASQAEPPLEPTSC